METSTVDTSVRLAGRLSERIRSVPPSGIRRFFEIAATMDDVISLGIGEPDFVSPQPIIDAAKASLDAGRTGYTANLGLADLRVAIADEMDRLYGLTYEPKTEIIATIGASEAMMIAMLAVVDPGDEVLIPEPCFVSYGPMVEFCGGTVVWVPTRAENDFQVTAEDIRSRITDKTKMLFLGYPNNPTGAVLRRDTLEAIAEVVVEHDLFVLSDEIYDRLVYGEAFDRGHVSVPDAPRPLRADDPDRRVLEGLRHDRLADRLRLRPEADHGSDVQGPPVRGDVGPDDVAGGGAGGHPRVAGTRRDDAPGLR